jgi:hypothetical protein
MQAAAGGAEALWHMCQDIRDSRLWGAERYDKSALNAATATRSSGR